MRRWYRSVLIASFCVVPTLQASVFFTFDDSGGNADFAYFEGTNNTTNPGLFTYLGAPTKLVVDGTQEGLGSTSFIAQLQMEITVGAVVGTIGGSVAAEILSGYLLFVDTNAGNETILSIELTKGGLLTLSSIGKLISSSNTSDIIMGEGPALAGFLGGQHLIPAFDISFLLTNISPFVSVNQDHFLTSFTANSVFTGSAELIPTPGSFALFGVGAMALSVRRRRRRNDLRIAC